MKDYKIRYGTERESHSAKRNSSLELRISRLKLFYLSNTGKTVLPIPDPELREYWKEMRHEKIHLALQSAPTEYFPHFPPSINRRLHSTERHPQQITQKPEENWQNRPKYAILQLYEAHWY